MTPRLKPSTAVLVACTVGNAVGVTPMLYSVFSLFLVPIATEFSWPRAAVSIVLLIVAAASALTYPVAGRLIDRLGGRPVLLVGLVLFATALFGVSVAPGNYWFYLAFFWLGVTAAIPSSLMYTKVIAGWFDQNRGLALGVAGGLGNGIGAALTPILAGALLAAGTWRTAYQGLALTTICVGLPVLILWLRDPPNAQLSENNEGEGMTPREARETSVFWRVLFAIGLGAGCLTAVHAHVVPLLTDRGLPVQLAINVLVTFSLVTAAWQVAVGYVLDRFPRPWIAVPFYLCALLGLWVLNTATDPTMLFVGAALLGLGLGTEYGVLPYFLSRYFGVRHYGAISGMVYGVIVLLQGLTPFLMDVNYDLLGSYDVALWVVAAALLAGSTILTQLPPFNHSSVDPSVAHR